MSGVSRWQRQLPILADEILSEAVVLLLLYQTKAGRLIDASGGDQHVVRPQRNFAIAGSPGEAGSGAVVEVGCARRQSPKDHSFILTISAHFPVIKARPGSVTSNNCPANGPDVHRILKTGNAEISKADGLAAPASPMPMFSHEGAATR